MLLAVVGRARESLVLFRLGVVGAALTLPLVGYFSRWVPRWVAVLAVSLVAAGAVGLVGYRAVDEVDRQTDRVADAIDESVARIEYRPRYSDLADRLDPPSGPTKSRDPARGRLVRRPPPVRAGAHARLGRQRHVHRLAVHGDDARRGPGLRARVRQAVPVTGHPGAGAHGDRRRP